MRTTLTIFAFTFLTLAGCGRAPSASPTSVHGPELKKLAGKWGIVSFGLPTKESIPASEGGNIVIDVIGSKVVAVKGAANEPSFSIISIDPDKTPKEVDLTPTDKVGKPEIAPTAPTTPGQKNVKTEQVVWKGIYNFDGENLVVAFAFPNQPRPTEFKRVFMSDDRSERGVVLVTLKRISDEDAIKRAAATTPGDIEKLYRMRLSSIGGGFFNYDSEKGLLPPQAIHGPDGKPILSWRVAILPYIGEKELYGKFKLDEPWDGPTNKPLIAMMPKTFARPGVDAGKGETYFKVFAGSNTVFNTSFDKKDKTSKNAWSVASLTSSPRGSSNTIFCVDAGDPVIWTMPSDIEYDAKKPLPKLNGVNDKGFFALMGDTRVVFIPKGIVELVLRAAIDPNSTSTSSLEP